MPHVPAVATRGVLRANGGDGSRDLEPGYVRRARRWRIFPEPLHDVRPVDAGGLYSHQHFRRTGLRHWTVDRAQDVGTAGAGDLDGGHPLRKVPHCHSQN
jgi:hypothetical protein